MQIPTEVRVFDEAAYLTDRQMAERYRVSRGTIWAWAKLNILPKPHHFGRAARWRRDEIMATEMAVARSRAI